QQRTDIESRTAGASPPTSSAAIAFCVSALARPSCYSLSTAGTVGCGRRNSGSSSRFPGPTGPNCEILNLHAREDELASRDRMASLGARRRRGCIAVIDFEVVASDVWPLIAAGFLRAGSERDRIALGEAVHQVMEKFVDEYDRRV